MVRLVKGYFGSSLARHDPLQFTLFLHAVSWPSIPFSWQGTTVAALANKLNVVTSIWGTSCSIFNDGSSHSYVYKLNPSTVTISGSIFAQIQINILKTFLSFLILPSPFTEKKTTTTKIPLFSEFNKSAKWFQYIPVFLITYIIPLYVSMKTQGKVSQLTPLK